MKKKRGKYVIKYSSGAANTLGETKTDEAIATARKEGLKDPDLQLVEITDQGGCAISWKSRSLMERLKVVFLRMCGCVRSFIV